jgi:hypothetical protein
MGSYLFILMTISIAFSQALGHSHAQAEPSPVQARWLDQLPPEGGWTVGDRIPLRLSVTYPAGFEVTLPRLPDVWGPFELQNQEILEPVEDRDGTVTTVSQMVVSLWAPGQFDAPPVTIQYRDEGGRLYETDAPALSVSVTSVLEEGDTEKADLKPQAVLPEPSRLPWVFGALLLLVLGGAAGWAGYQRFWLRPRTASERMPMRDPRLPHEIAHSELTRIEALDLPARDEFKLHYSLVADCVRAYVVGRYCIPALDLTTEELSLALRKQNVKPPHAATIRDFLAQADLVKFAKYRPHREYAYGTIAGARQIVDITTPTQREGGPAAHDGETASSDLARRDPNAEPTCRETLDH